MRNIFAMIAVVVAGLFAGCASTGAGSPAASAGSRPAVQHLDAAGALKLVNTGKVVVLDVRTPPEFAAGHVKGARLVDFKAPDFEAQLAGLDRNQKYLVHCASGRRSTQSLAVFEKLGFAKVVHLDGGFNAWQAAGNPVEK